MKNLLTLVLAALFTTSTLQAQMKIVSNGNVGIGTETPAEKLHVNGSIRGDQTEGAIKIQTEKAYTTIGAMNTSFSHFNTNSPNFYFQKGVDLGTGFLTSYTNVNLTLCTSSNFTPRMTIKYSNGYVGINNSNPSYLLDVNGIIRASNVSVSSDIRLKTDIKDIPSDAISKLSNLNAKSYKPLLLPTKDHNNLVKSDTIVANTVIDSLQQKTTFGFIAQDIYKYFPELVNEDKDGYLSVNYIGLIPILVEAMKEQQVKIEQLEKKVAAMSKQKTKTLE
jgi:hypothetical protein